MVLASVAWYEDPKFIVMPFVVSVKVEEVEGVEDIKGMTMNHLKK
jgi:hypothetical protein